MSSFVQIPNRISQLTTKSKLNEIFIYAAIRSQIKDSSYTASISEKELSELTGVTERTVRNYIANLKSKSDLFVRITQKQGESKFPYNVYELDYLSDNYFTINPNLIYRQDLPVSLKGLLLLIKTFCVKGTNYLFYDSKEQLAKQLHISKNNIGKYLKELESKGYIRFIDKSIHLSLDYFYLSTKDSIYNRLYETIYFYCLSKNAIPPYKDRDTHDLSLIAAQYIEADMLLKALEKRCPTLPTKVSFAYLTQVLRNKSAYKEVSNENVSFILD